MIFLWPCAKPRPCASSGMSNASTKSANPFDPFDAKWSSLQPRIQWGIPGSFSWCWPMKASCMPSSSVKMISSIKRNNSAWVTGDFATILCICWRGGSSGSSSSRLHSVVTNRSWLRGSNRTKVSGMYVSAKLHVMNNFKGPNVTSKAWPKCRSFILFPSVSGTTAVLVSKCFSAFIAGLSCYTQAPKQNIPAIHKHQNKTYKQKKHTIDRSHWHCDTFLRT